MNDLSDILIIVVRMKVVHVLKSASNAFCCDLHFQKKLWEDPQTTLPKLSVTPLIQILDPPLHTYVLSCATVPELSCFDKLSKIVESVLTFC
jgi:hypothetical protein